MLDRIIPTSLFRGHWKGLSDYRGSTPKPDTLTRLFIVGAPVAAGVFMLISGGKLSAPSALLSAVALFSGGLLASFGQLSTLRLKLTDRTEDNQFSERIDRDFLDETAAHLLVAAYSAAVSAALLVMAMSFGSDPDGRIGGAWAAVITATTTYVFVVFIIALPRLYVAYTRINKVRRELSGTASSKL